jgi:hypothetical protein
LHNNEVLFKNILKKNYPFLAGAAAFVAVAPVAALKASSTSLGKANFNLIATRMVKLSAIEGCA